MNSCLTLLPPRPCQGTNMSYFKTPSISVQLTLAKTPPEFKEVVDNGMQRSAPHPCYSPPSAGSEISVSARSLARYQKSQLAVRRRKRMCKEREGSVICRIRQDAKLNPFPCNEPCNLCLYLTIGEHECQADFLSLKVAKYYWRRQDTPRRKC